MADQLGRVGHPSAISKWLTLEHLPLRQVEERARQVLEEQRLNQKSLDLPEPVPAPAPAPAAPENNVLMVVCPPGSEERVQRVLAMLGCEVEVI
jgi:hypothetical protein